MLSGLIITTAYLAIGPNCSNLIARANVIFGRSHAITVHAACIVTEFEQQTCYDQYEQNIEYALMAEFWKNPIKMLGTGNGMHESMRVCPIPGGLIHDDDELVIIIKSRSNIFVRSALDGKFKILSPMNTAKSHNLHTRACVCVCLWCAYAQTHTPLLVHACTFLTCYT